MIFSAPIPFTEALQHQQAKKLMPTTASAAELARLAPEIRERAFFSARTNNAWYLQRQHNLVTSLVSPQTVVDPATGQSRPARPGEYQNPAYVRTRLKQALAEIGYTPDKNKRGGLQDLGSDRRLDLIIEMQSGFSRGYANELQAQEPAILDMWPASELYRARTRNKRRAWGTRWNDAIRTLGSATSAKPVSNPFAESGMIALKNDRIWIEISAFGLPYPPFDYKSGMRKRDVDRDRAEALGVIKPEETVAPKRNPLNQDVHASSPVPEDSPLFATLMQTLGKAISFDGGSLVMGAN